MECKNQSLRYKKCMFCETKEHQLETQLNLPDYYPDVCRILSCKVNTYVESFHADSDRINADGIAVIRLLYCDDEKNMHLFETEQRFSKSTVMPSGIKSPILSCDYKTENLHYRAIGPRRVDVKSYISLTAEVAELTQLDCAVPQSENIEVLMQEYDLFDVSSCYCDTFVINEDFTLRDERIADSKLLNDEAHAYITETKVVKDKVLIKGFVELNLAYFHSKSQTIFKYTENIPYSQIFDIYGISETDKVCVMLKAMHPVLSVKDGEDCELSLKVKADICAGEIKAVSIISDLYGVNCDVNFLQQETALQKNGRVFSDIFSVHSDTEKIDYADFQIVSYYVTDVIFTTKHNSEKVNVKGQVQISIIAITDGELQCLNRNIQFDYARETENCNDADAQLNVTCKSVTCNKSQNNLQIKAELELTGYCLFNENIVHVLNPEIEYNMKQNDFDTVTLYFAQGGEKVWDIAKQNKVSRQLLKNVNALTEEMIEDKKVLILLHSEAGL